MALPAANTTWPPKPFDTALAQIRVHDAWYVGDPDVLHATYAGNAGATRVASRQRTGGLVGAVIRFFWGRPTPADQQRTRLHVPVAADIATTSADLLFSEPPRILLPKTERPGPDGKTAATDHPAQERLEEIVNSPVVHATLLETAELAAAHGGAYLRISWDTSVADHPMLTGVAADGAIPEWRYGRLSAVTFWTVLSTDSRHDVVRHLERHEVGRVLHGVYVGTADSLGRAVPLADFPQTAWAAPLVDAESAIATGATGLTAVFIPNMLPQRRWRRITELAPLGRSDFDGIEGIFDAIDEAYSSWMRDVRLAKARVFVDQSILDSNGVGEGATFDDDREVFTGLNGLAGSMREGAQITAQQFDIRWQEHQKTIQDLTRVALRSAGYSPASFGDDSSTAQETATQVKSRDRLSERTRDKKIRYWKTALAHVARTMLEVDATVFRPNGHDSTLPEVRFPETAQQDIFELAQTIEALHRAEAISTDLKVRMFHPDWDAIKVEEEVERITGAATFADPFAERGTDVTTDAQDLKTRSEAAGTLVRLGATQESSAKEAGFEGLKFTGERPITTRPVNSDE